ncbi:MAG: hypothetical protein IT186_15945 [Acidobacteria bacterium]|nr:hypothetical protein [Acidobacteriota bacterium]
MKTAMTYTAGVGLTFEQADPPGFSPVSEDGFSALTVALRRFGQGVPIDQAGNTILNQETLALARELVRLAKTELPKALNLAAELIAAEERRQK